MRAIELTLGTIILLVTLLTTMVAVILFFQGGFSTASGGIATLFSGAQAEAKAPGLAPEDISCNDLWYLCKKIDSDEVCISNPIAIFHYYESCTESIPPGRDCRCLNPEP